MIRFINTHEKNVFDLQHTTRLASSGPKEKKLNTVKPYMNYWIMDILWQRMKNRCWLMVYYSFWFLKLFLAKVTVLSEEFLRWRHPLKCWWRKLSFANGGIPSCGGGNFHLLVEESCSAIASGDIFYWSWWNLSLLMEESFVSVATIRLDRGGFSP